MTCCPCLLPYDAAGGDSIFYLSPYPARHIVRINLFQAVHAGKGRQVLCLRTGQYWMALMYAAYTAGAVYGYFHWKKHGKVIS